MCAVFAAWEAPGSARAAAHTNHATVAKRLQTVSGRRPRLSSFRTGNPCSATSARTPFAAKAGINHATASRCGM